ncbi:RHS repeat-associated core domain-containing protein [Kitasatospora sp. NPDC049258]|uniref:RHS repeat-associated core domain-containing protein n=1 Tax=Kitasatospora sp. NPDC049258 TaxID=3155394 RepID=UPI00342D812A
MSNQIVKALEHGAQKLGKTLAEDAGKALKSFYRKAGDNLKKVAHNTREIETEHARELEKIMGGHGGGGVPHPRSGPGGHGPRGSSHPKGRGRDQVRSPRTEGRPQDTRCGGGEPVDMATGRMYIDQVDAALPGSLPLLFTRGFDSGYGAGRWMGERWVCTFDERLEIDAEGVVHIRPDRITQAYPHPEPGDPVFASAGSRHELDLTDDGRYTVTDRSGGLVREFTPAPDGTEALLTRVRDRHGRHYDLAYDDDGVPLSITHSGGYRLLVTVDADRITALRLANATDAGGDAMLMRYGYTDGHLSAVYNSSGKPMRFANDQSGRMLSWTDRNDSRYRYTYDQHDRVVDEGGADGSLRFRFTYGDPDPATGARAHTETNALGHTTTYLVNDRAQITAITDPLGHTTRFERDEFDRLLTETDPLGRTTRYDYDGAGDLVSVTRPDGERTTATYASALSLPEVVTEPGGATWRYTYDEAGRRTSVTDPSGAVTRYTFDESGHLASVTNALGSSTLVRCTPAGLPMEVTDPAAATTRFQHDAFGRTRAVTGPMGDVTRHTWTVEGYPRTRTAPDGSTESWTYDGEGNLLTHTDQLGQVSTFEYTHFETPASATGPDGARYAYSYDAQMQLASVTNPLGRTWDYTYDAAGRLVAERDFDGRVVSYQLDPAGQVIARTNPLGQEVRYTYDLLGRMTAKRAGDRVTTYSYDLAGHLVRAAGPDAEVVRTVDVLGNLVTESVNGRTLTQAWDGLGRRVQRTTPGGHVSNWTFDSVGRPTTLGTSGGDLGFTFDLLGREQRRSYGEHLSLTTTWNARFQLTGQILRTSAPSGHATLQQRSYSYRADGNLTAVEDLPAGRRSFEIDRAGRVTGVRAEDWVETYAYDQAGNLAAADWPASGSTKAALGARTYDGTQLTSAGRIRYEYDAAGRITLRQKSRLSKKPENWRYTWDADGHLTGVLTPDGTQWRYLYDPFGRRIAKQRLGGDGVTVEEQTDFTWDGPTLAEQATRAPYLPGLHTLSWDHYELHPLIQSETITTSVGEDTQEHIDRRFFAVVTDLVGSPTELVDLDTETIAWRATTTVWGNTTWPSASSGYTPLRFPGQYFDPETRLHYNVNRYYDPETARYASPDPLGLAPAPNPVAYVHNPHTWSDPLGLSPHQHDDLLAAVKLEADKSTKITPSKMRPVASEGLKLPNGTVWTSPSIRGGGARAAS